MNEKALLKLLTNIISNPGIYTPENTKLLNELTNVELKPNMVEITIDNYDYETFEFNGVICFEGQADSYIRGIVMQDAYYAPKRIHNDKGHGYDGYGDQNAIYFHEDDFYLPHGVYFNSTSRQDQIEDLLKRNFKVYKCRNKEAFAYWLLGKSVEEINGMEL